MMIRRLFRVAALAVGVLGFLLAGLVCARDPDVHFVATPQKAVEEMLKVAKVTRNDIVYDLGCGDGRIVITAAKLYGARGIGVDIDPDRIRESVQRAAREGVADRVTFILGDLFTMDMREATVVFLYLLPDLNEQLRPKLLRELKPGARVISHEFGMGAWQPDYSGTVRDVEIYYYANAPTRKDTNFYYWVIPADATGLWWFSLPASRGKRSLSLRIAQKFQEVSGGVKAGGREVPVEDARLTGDLLSFTLTEEVRGGKSTSRFEGRVRGDRIEGTVETHGQAGTVTRPWSAYRGG